MIEQLAYPLSWPLGWKRTSSPADSRFGNGYTKPSVAKARDFVIHELALMNVGDWDIVISTNLPLRRDGMPYSNQPDPKDKGVAIYFKVAGKPTVLACDRWNTVGDNIWAIGKHIEAMRGQGRWGVGSLKQAFAGYVALPLKTEDSWQEVLGLSANPSIDQIRAAYREKAKQSHPDTTGGNSEAFQKVQAAFQNACQWWEANHLHAGEETHPRGG